MAVPRRRDVCRACHSSFKQKTRWQTPYYTCLLLNALEKAHLYLTAGKHIGHFAYALPKPASPVIKQHHLALAQNWWKKKHNNRNDEMKKRSNSENKKKPSKQTPHGSERSVNDAPFLFRPNKDNARSGNCWRCAKRWYKNLKTKAMWIFPTQNFILLNRLRV